VDVKTFDVYSFGDSLSFCLCGEFLGVAGF